MNVLVLSSRSWYQALFVQGLQCLHFLFMLIYCGVSVGLLQPAEVSEMAAEMLWFRCDYDTVTARACYPWGTQGNVLGFQG